MLRAESLQRLSRMEFLPGVSAKVRQVVYSPLGVLVVAFLVAVLCGLALHPRVFALAGGLGLVVALGVCWPWLSLRGTRASIRFLTARATEGECVEVSAEVTNHLPWPVFGLRLTERRKVHTQADGETTVRLGRVPSRSRVLCRWHFTPSVRGEYPRAVPALSTGFPFGIWEPERTSAVESSLLVWPRTFPVGPVPVSEGVEVVDGNVARNKVGTLGDVLGVRPYRRGDSPRRIHWAQSAKHDRLIVCELQSNSRPVVMLVLDADSRVHHLGPNGSREWAIRVVASFAKGWLEAGAQVGVTWDGFFLPVASGVPQVRRILDALARLPEIPAQPIGAVLRTPDLSRSPGLRVVVTSDRSLRESTHRTEEYRWVVLKTAGFPGENPVALETTGSCDEAPPRVAPKAWLTLTDHLLVPRALRQGTSEAKHGS